jgi:hypothetical protein
LVSLSVSFYLYYFLSSSEHFLLNELSQFFAPIPGGGTCNIRFRSALVVGMMVLHVVTIQIAIAAVESPAVEA